MNKNLVDLLTTIAINIIAIAIVGGRTTWSRLVSSHLGSHLIAARSLWPSKLGSVVRSDSRVATSSALDLGASA